MSVLLTLDPKTASGDWASIVTGRIAEALRAGSTVTIEAEIPSVTPQQVADELGLSRATVMRRIQIGDLRAFKRGNRHRIPATEVERFRASYITELGAAFADDF